jgi:hypothetical protein
MSDEWQQIHHGDTEYMELHGEKGVRRNLTAENAEGTEKK